MAKQEHYSNNSPPFLKEFFADGSGRAVSLHMVFIYLVAIPIAWMSLWFVNFLNQPYLKDHGFEIKRLVRREPLNVIVSGANSGLGLGTVQNLAALPNMNVIMACRNIQKCEEAKDSVADRHPTSHLECMKLDLASKASIEEFSKAVKSKGDQVDGGFPIHVLINNAGLADFTAKHIDGFNSIVYINQMSHFYLTHLLWEVLAEGGRVVTVASIGATLPYNATAYLRETSEAATSFVDKLQDYFFSFNSYIRSKRTNLMFCHEMYRRFTKVDTICAHPGYTRTPIFQKAPGITSMSFLRNFLAENTLFGMTIREGSLPQVRAALDPKLTSGDYIGPRYWVQGPPVPVAKIGNRTSHYWPFTKEESENFWETSMKAFNITEFGKV